MKELGSLFKDRINESILNDAIKKSKKCFKPIGCEFSLIKNGMIKEMDFMRNIVESGRENFIYGYIEGVEDAINCKMTENQLKPSNATNCEFIKNNDFAFIFDFNDNDFGLHIEDCAKELVAKFNELIRVLNLYSSIEGATLMVDSYIKDLQKIQNKEFLKVFFQTTFLGSYLKRYFDFIDKEISYDKALEKAKRLAEEYIGFQNDNQWLIGTVEEIEKYVKNEFEETTDGETYCWNNGETLIFKFKNGIIDYMII
jgi:hypothetical protein